MIKNGNRAGKGAAHSVGSSNITALEFKRHPGTAQAARKAADARLVASVHELRAALTRCSKKAVRRYYYDYEGTHAGPMQYIARLAQPEHEEAWLFGKFVDGEPEKRLLCHVSANSGNELHECAEALWLEGAHPDSVLELWWGESPGSKTPDRMMRATLYAAVPKAWWQRCLV